MRDELGCGDLGWKVHKGSSQQYQFPTKVRNGQENFFESMESLQKKEILSSDLPRDREAWSDLPGDPISASTELTPFT